MRENTPLADFQMIIRNFPMALSLYLKYCRDHNPQALFDIYHQEDNFNAQAAEYIRESFEPKVKLSYLFYMIKRTFKFYSHPLHFARVERSSFYRYE